MSDNKMTAEQALERAFHKFELCGATTEWEIIRAALSAPRVPDLAVEINRFDDAGFVCRHGSDKLHCTKAVQEIDIDELRDLVVGYWGIANKMLAASPEPVADSEWIDIPANLRRPSNIEQHAQQVIDDLRAEVEALKAKLAEVIGCFDAAEAEGWSNALRDGDIVRLNDLWTRRIAFAYDAARQIEGYPS